MFSGNLVPYQEALMQHSMRILERVAEPHRLVSISEISGLRIQPKASLHRWTPCANRSFAVFLMIFSLNFLIFFF
jgi:hypothetical protein